ncbi:MAG: UDP-glucose 4-epimerase GalE [Terriglobales bacterium]
MNILLAGGAGYIGSVISTLLLDHGHTVTVYDNFSRGHRDAVPAGALVVEGDVGDQERLARAFTAGSIEGVVHLAALIEVGESVREPYKYLENNLLRAVALLAAMERTGVRLLVLSSTAALYAPSPQPLREISPLAPASPYGLSKLFLERLLAWYATRGLRYYALRYFNAAGATGNCGERHQPESHLIPLVLEAAAGERDAIQVFGTDYATADGTCVRDYIHVQDLADAHLMALEELHREASAGAGTDRQLQQPAPSVSGHLGGSARPRFDQREGSADREQPRDLAERAFNLGNGAGFSVREVIAAAERVCGHRIPQIVRPRRGGDVDRLVADASKMRALGWRPLHTDLEAIIASAWEWKQTRRHGPAPQLR